MEDLGSREPFESPALVPRGLASRKDEIAGDDGREK
jgi:hypothetical protein